MTTARSRAVSLLATCVALAWLTGRGLLEWVDDNLAELD